MLLVGSVYLDHARSRKWYELQMEFLRATTGAFRHVVYLNGLDNFYAQSDVIRVTGDPTPRSAASHCEGLNAIVRHYEIHGEFSHLLILDSDCFPIRENWQSRLIKAMDQAGKRFARLDRGFDAAAVVRAETLDTFAHPSAFFARRRIPGLRFGLHRQVNLVGHAFYDSSPNITVFYPMVRSNVTNRSPLIAGVYWDTFYHHGAGSRNLVFKYPEYFLWKPPTVEEEQEMFNDLVRDPSGFLEALCPTKGLGSIKML